MENIRQAVERAKGRQDSGPGPERQGRIGASVPRRQTAPGLGGAHPSDASVPETELDGAYLQARRIVSHDGKDPNSRSFDILRTQVLRSMDLKGWRILAVTSPTPGCGKTLTALNLALSIARQPERSVLVVDLDLRKPQVAAGLGLKREKGVLGVLEDQVALTAAIMPVRVGGCRFDVLPTVASLHSSDLMTSSAMGTLLQDIRSDSQSRIVILDLPPMLTGNEVIAILPQVDCVLLVAAVGISAVSEIEECNKHLQSTDVVRFVLNKVPESSANYYYY